MASDQTKAKVQQNRPAQRRDDRAGYRPPRADGSLDGTPNRTPTSRWALFNNTTNRSNA
jgi:hypothetical protein